MRFLLKIVAISTVPAWTSLHILPAAAQTFDERWSIIPNAHAEPAPPARQVEPAPATPQAQPAPATPQAERAPATPQAERAPTTPEEKKPDMQARRPIGGESAHGSEHRSATRSFNRVFSGKASYYSYQTGKTASGSSFNRNLPTAAHRSLPFGTRVRVTDLATNRSVVVVITDRGPSVRDRVLDLSLGAARGLGITDRGVARVRAEVL
jgi:rare lipoprotein A